jgi:hypothetical protein
MVIPSSSSSSFIVERRRRSSSDSASFLLPRFLVPLSFLKYQVEVLVSMNELRISALASAAPQSSAHVSAVHWPSPPAPPASQSTGIATKHEKFEYLLIYRKINVRNCVFCKTWSVCWLNIICVSSTEAQLSEAQMTQAQFTVAQCRMRRRLRRI